MPGIVEFAVCNLSVTDGSRYTFLESVSSLSRKIDTWQHCDRTVALRVLNLSLSTLYTLEENGDLTPMRNEAGRVFYERAEVEKLRDARRKNKAELAIVDVDAHGNYVVCPPGYDPRVEDESVRHRNEMEMREREFSQRAESMRDQKRLIGLLEKFAPRVIEALERQSWSHVAHTAITAIPEEQRSELIRAVIDVVQAGTK